MYALTSKMASLEIKRKSAHLPDSRLLRSNRKGDVEEVFVDVRDLGLKSRKIADVSENHDWKNIRCKPLTCLQLSQMTTLSNFPQKSMSTQGISLSSIRGGSAAVIEAVVSIPFGLEEVGAVDSGLFGVEVIVKRVEEEGAASIECLLGIDAFAIGG